MYGCKEHGSYWTPVMGHLRHPLGEVGSILQIADEIFIVCGLFAERWSTLVYYISVRVCQGSIAYEYLISNSHRVLIYIFVMCIDE